MSPCGFGGSAHTVHGGTKVGYVVGQAEGGRQEARNKHLAHLWTEHILPFELASPINTFKQCEHYFQVTLVTPVYRTKLPLASRTSMASIS